MTAEFGRFYHPSLAPDVVRTFGFHEWLERGFSRAGFRRLAARVNIAGNTTFAKSVCGLMAREPVAAVWGYDTSSADVFAFAKERGIVRILDKTIGDPRVYNALMKDIYAEYKPFFSSPNFAVPQSVIDLQDREYTLADGIVVGSDFCRDTILDPLARPDLAGKIDVLPYCYDDVFFQPGPPATAADQPAGAVPLSGPGGTAQGHSSSAQGFRAFAAQCCNADHCRPIAGAGGDLPPIFGPRDLDLHRATFGSGRLFA